jgi:hypothetical protein
MLTRTHEARQIDRVSRSDGTAVVRRHGAQSRFVWTAASQCHRFAPCVAKRRAAVHSSCRKNRSRRTEDLRGEVRRARTTVQDRRTHSHLCVGIPGVRPPGTALNFTGNRPRRQRRWLLFSQRAVRIPGTTRLLFARLRRPASRSFIISQEGVLKCDCEGTRHLVCDPRCVLFSTSSRTLQPIATAGPHGAEAQRTAVQEGADKHKDQQV